MILKELDPFTAHDPLAKTGRRAEEQMAFYLRRSFAASSPVRVLNGVHLERGGDTAQIDHLILHRWGAVIVESKSVTSQVEINERGEWTRLWNGRPKGMPSPVLQGRRQGEFLRHFLEDHAEVLLGKILGLVQARFGTMPVDVIVAVSDDGIIRQPKQNAQDAVCKADQVPDRIRVLIEGHRKAASLFHFNLSAGYQWSEQELERIITFLQEQHVALNATTASPVEHPSPIEAVEAEPLLTITSPTTKLAATPLWSQEATPPTPPLSHACRACEGHNLTVEYGRYGYYFKCGECGGNTSIKAVCRGCGSKARLRKSGREFYAECPPCQRSDLFFVNPAVQENQPDQDNEA